MVFLVVDESIRKLDLETYTQVKFYMYIQIINIRFIAQIIHSSGSLKTTVKKLNN